MAKNRRRVKNTRRGKKDNPSSEPHSGQQSATHISSSNAASSKFAARMLQLTQKPFKDDSLSALQASALQESAKSSKPAKDQEPFMLSLWKGPIRELTSGHKPAGRRLEFPRPFVWLPFRGARWVYKVGKAISRAYWGPHQEDLFLTFCLTAISIIAGYIATGILFSMLHVVAAKGIDANCSIVYVTIPGPIVTVSLIGATPSDPIRGTYYFSVVNGTTEWLNSIAPPSRVSIRNTTTTGIIPASSPITKSRLSLPSYWTLATTDTPSIPALPPPVASPPPLARTSATMTLSDSTLLTTAIISTSHASSSPPPQLSLPSVVSSPGVPSFHSVSRPPTSINQPQRPWPSPVVLSSTVVFSTSSSSIISALISPAVPPKPLSSIIASQSRRLSGASSTPSNPLVPSLTSVEGATTIISPTATSSSVLITSFSASIRVTNPVPSGPKLTLTGEFTTVVSSAPLARPSVPANMGASTLLITLINTMLDGMTTALPSRSTIMHSGASYGTSSGPGLPVTSNSFSTLTNSHSDYLTTIITSISTFAINIPHVPPKTPSNPGLAVTTRILTIATSKSPNGQPSATPSILLTTISGTIAALTSSRLSPVSPSTPTRTESGAFTVQLPKLSTESLISQGISVFTSFTITFRETTAVAIETSNTVSSTTGSYSSSSLSPPFTPSTSSNSILISSLTLTRVPVPMPSNLGPGLPRVSFTMSSSYYSALLNATISANASSSSSTRLSTSVLASVSIRTRSLLAVTPTLALTSTTSFVVTTLSSAGSNSTSLLHLRGLTTKVISYGDTAVSFVFPSPDITTTVSYWSGEYPSVTGPLPLELQAIPLTTRTNRQTPLSALPSFQLLTSKPSRFRTVVTTIPEDDGEPTAAAAAAKPSDMAATRAQSTATELIDRAPTEISMAIAEPGPTLCGESGNFTLTFDDTVIGNDDNAMLVASGMKNPYHHLFYANGFTYVPDKWEPFPAVSQPNVAMFLPLTGRLLPNTPFAGTLLPGELGAGPRASVNAYWFNAHSAYFGCALNGITPCTLRISGYRYDSVLKEEVIVVEQNATLPACWGYINCQLTQVLFEDGFKGLSGIQFNAYTHNLGIPQVHMMDNLHMEWYNNSCSAGILRIGHR